MAPKLSTLAAANTADNTRTPADEMVRKTLAAGLDTDRTLWVQFRGCEGKGTGVQSVKGADMPGLIAAIEDAIEYGVQEDEDNLSAEQMFRRTFALRGPPKDAPEGVYCTFRTTGGKGDAAKGAKPTVMLVDELPAFLTELRACSITALRGVANAKGIRADEVEYAASIADRIAGVNTDDSAE